MRRSHQSSAEHVSLRLLLSGAAESRDGTATKQSHGGGGGGAKCAVVRCDRSRVCTDTSLG